MEKHIHLLSILYIAFSIMGVLTALVVFVILTGGGILSGDEQALFITSAVGTTISTIIFIFSIPGIIGGYALYKGKNWARILIMILAAFNLFNIPLGTILGVYTFWVLLQEESMRYFDKTLIMDEEPVA